MATSDGDEDLDAGIAAAQTLLADRAAQAERARKRALLAALQAQVAAPASSSAASTHRPFSKSAGRRGLRVTELRPNTVRGDPRDRDCDRDRDRDRDHYRSRSRDRDDEQRDRDRLSYLSRSRSDGRDRDRDRDRVDEQRDRDRSGYPSRNRSDGRDRDRDRDRDRADEQRDRRPRDSHLRADHRERDGAAHGANRDAERASKGDRSRRAVQSLGGRTWGRERTDVVARRLPSMPTAPTAPAGGHLWETYKWPPNPAATDAATPASTPAIPDKLASTPAITATRAASTPAITATSAASTLATPTAPSAPPPMEAPATPPARGAKPVPSLAGGAGSLLWLDVCGSGQPQLLSPPSGAPEADRSSSSGAGSPLIESLRAHGGSESGAFNWRGLAGAVAPLLRTPLEWGRASRPSNSDSDADSDVTVLDLGPTPTPSSSASAGRPLTWKERKAMPRRPSQDNFDFSDADETPQDSPPLLRLFNHPAPPPPCETSAAAAAAVMCSDGLSQNVEWDPPPRPSTRPTLDPSSPRRRAGTPRRRASSRRRRAGSPRRRASTAAASAAEASPRSAPLPDVRPRARRSTRLVGGAAPREGARQGALRLGGAPAARLQGRR